jgi:hypothetical protein
MKYLENLETNQIVKGEEFGAFFDSWIELTQDEIDAYELEKAKLPKIAQCQVYLESTDWQAAAFIKYGRPIDTNVSENCLKANQWKVDIASCTTLEELNAININFQ